MEIKVRIMKSPKIAITVVTVGLIIFTWLCNSRLNVPAGLLFIFLFILQIGLLWMVYTILKYGKASTKTFDDHFYEDANLKNLP